MKTALLLALATTLLFAACKRPGTDRALQCERYAESQIERQVECSGSVDGVALTSDNAAELSSKAQAACMAHKSLTPTHECLKQLKAAPCDGNAPKWEAMPACVATPK